VPKLRISIVEYLNTAPLVWGFTEGPLSGKYELDFAVPSMCAEALRSGAADIGIIPAIEYQRIPDLVMFPEMAVAAKGPVRSILVIAKEPIEKARRFALDISSRSSQALVRMLSKRWWHAKLSTAPEFVPARPHAADMLAEADAALVIGDPALRIAVKLDEMAERKPGGEHCCDGDPSAMPVPGFPSLYLYDVGAEWRLMTGLPCVLAVWAARRAAATPEVVADFLASREYGLAHIGDIAEGASLKLDLPASALETYLRDNIDFSLDEQNRAGLDLYYRCAAEDGLIPSAREIEWATMPSAAGARAM
jgi:predicted solute-binding protein